MSEVTNSSDLPDVVMPSCGVHKVLRGQKALVTGANSGIGRAVAIAMGQAGSDVVVNYVRDEFFNTEKIESYGAELQLSF